MGLISSYSFVIFFVRLSAFVCFIHSPSIFLNCFFLLSEFFFRFTGGEGHDNPRYMRSTGFLSVLWSLNNSFPTMKSSLLQKQRLKLLIQSVLSLANVTREKVLSQLLMDFRIKPATQVI